MSIANWMRSAVTGMLLERPGQKLSLPEHAEKLAETGESLLAQAETTGDSEQNRAQLRHIIGIERWSQRRLRVGLGESVPDDEYDSYQPSPDTEWPDLLADFEAARADTIDLVSALIEADADTHLTVPHNQYGSLTIAAWLRYVALHTTWESKRIR
jgi:hypothetical protein